MGADGDITEKDDLPGCKVVDCTKILAEEICPKTCSEQKICKVVDCTKPESSKFCPKTCAEISKTDMYDEYYDDPYSYYDDYYEGINSPPPPLAVNCEWGLWTVGPCSATCGSKGVQTNKRIKTKIETHGGTCLGSSTKTIGCNRIECSSIVIEYVKTGGLCQRKGTYTNIGSILFPDRNCRDRCDKDFSCTGSLLPTLFGGGNTKWC